MKRSLLSAPPGGIPQVWEPLLKDAEIYDSSCSPEARVYFVNSHEGQFYLKRAACTTLRREAEMTAYFYRKRMGAEVLSYTSTEEADWLMTARVPGEDATHATYLAEPKRLAVLLGTELRRLHEMNSTDCPVQDRMGEYLALAEENYRKGLFDPSFLPPDARSMKAEDARRVLREAADTFKNDTLLHGDFCLPNVMLSDWQLSGYIDVDHSGVGDRHVDLFWGAWTLGFNLGTDAYRDLFFDAYGRDRIDRELLTAVAAAETFG